MWGAQSPNLQPCQLDLSIQHLEGQRRPGVGLQQPTGQVLPEGRGCRELRGVSVQCPLDLTSEQGGVGALVRIGGTDLTSCLPSSGCVSSTTASGGDRTRRSHLLPRFPDISHSRCPERVSDVAKATQYQIQAPTSPSPEPFPTTPWCPQPTHIVWPCPQDGPSSPYTSSPPGLGWAAGLELGGERGV